MKHYRLHLEKFYKYQEAQFVDHKNLLKMWEEPLQNHIDEDTKYKLHLLRNADQLHRLNNRLHTALFSKVLMLPVSKAHGGGAAMTCLIMEVSEVFSVNYSIAFDIVAELLDIGGRFGAIKSKGSFRVSKSKLFGL